MSPLEVIRHLKLTNSPVQLTPLPEYPALQAQVNPRKMEVHNAFELQLFKVEFAQKFWAAKKEIKQAFVKVKSYNTSTY